MNKTRNKSVDIAKSLGIILVVLGHTDCLGKNFIYQFHLPLFFFLSGYVFSEKYLDRPKEFIKKRVKSLYMPFVLLESLFLLFHNLFVKIGLYNELSNTKLILNLKNIIVNFFKILTLGYGEQLAGPLYFLISLLEINILFWCLLKISKKFKNKGYLICILISTILFFVGCYTKLPRMLSQSLIGLFFYSFGFLFKKIEKKIKFRLDFFIILSIIVWVCSRYNFVDISKLSITYKPLLIISGLCGTYLILYIANKLEFLNNKFILYCGENTLYVLAFHFLAFKIIVLIELIIYKVDFVKLGIFPAYQQNLTWSIILTFFGVIIPLGINKLKDLIKYKINKVQNLKLKGENRYE